MRIRIKMIIMSIFISTLSNGQTTLPNLFTNSEYNDNVNTNDNVTKINLYNLDFNGENVPINLIYKHDGINLNESPNLNGLGLHWKMEEIGSIKTQVRGVTDYFQYGWFNTLEQDYNTSTQPLSSTSDLSPDLFSLKIANGNYFDFCYKKNIQNGVIGTPIPVFLLNNDGYKISTNFNNFNTNDVIFKIYDKKGTNYDFIKGPPVQDNFSYYNYYIKSMYNPNNDDFINIQYDNKEIFKSTGYKTGANIYNEYILFPQDNNCLFNNDISNFDYDNNIIRHKNNVVYEVSESRSDIKKITTNKVVVNFVYSLDNKFLEEINITDVNGIYITGYKFVYQDSGSTAKQLFQIKRFDNTKTKTETTYEFEYYHGDVLTYLYDSGRQGDPDSMLTISDYMGYPRSDSNSGFLFKTKNVGFWNNPRDCSVNNSGDFTPNLEIAKSLSLIKIKNKYSGVIEFDYILNKGVGERGELYGGGLVISSKKIVPVIGVTKYIKYEYDYPSGFLLQLYDINPHFIKESIRFGALNNYNANVKFYSSNPKLLDISQDSSYLINIHKNGNFFYTVSESVYDFDSMLLKSNIVKNFTPNYEGIYRTPILKKEIFKNELDQVIKIKEYKYSYQTIDIINGAEMETENIMLSPVRNISYVKKTNFPIYVNRVTLLNVKEEDFFQGNSIVNNLDFNFLNLNSKLLRSKITTSALGDVLEKKYYYSEDAQMANEPYVNNLIASNTIGVPLKTEIYINNEKLSEQKIIYAKDASTNNLLLPKYILSKKGTDSNSNLENKITFNNYDSSGNLLEQTLENGIPVCTIWGYNKTLPIARIENIKYSAIPANLITAIQNASNLPNNEANLLLALDAIHNDTSLANAMVTTYTHISLVGVSTVTDAKKDKIIYSYDAFNRLKFVKDKNGKILSENEYNYKPQN